MPRGGQSDTLTEPKSRSNCVRFFLHREEPLIYLSEAMRDAPQAQTHISSCRQLEKYELFPIKRQKPS